MNNPYKIDRPGVVSFSGGLTSGYMLWHIIDAYGGKLPEDIKVIFANTGKERQETLTFVERCSIEWNVEVIWLEYTSTLKDRPPGKARNGKMESPYDHGFRLVNYATASRKGEPLEAIIQTRDMLPNVMARFCTTECKIRTKQRYLLSIGWENWTDAIGFRADEPLRVAKLRTTNQHANEEPVAPLHASGVTKSMVHEWWARQPFTLGLMEHEGNCDLCFLKSASKLRRIMKDQPDLATWWIEREAKFAGKATQEWNTGPVLFRRDRPRYSVQLELAQRPGLFDDIEEQDELSISCSCTD